MARKRTSFNKYNNNLNHFQNNWQRKETKNKNNIGTAHTYRKSAQFYLRLCVPKKITLSKMWRIFPSSITRTISFLLPLVVMLCLNICSFVLPCPSWPCHICPDEVISKQSVTFSPLGLYLSQLGRGTIRILILLLISNTHQHSAVSAAKNLIFVE